MSLFNFSRPSNDDQQIQLIVNDETITVPAGEANGMTVEQAFGRYASSYCDTGRINRYVAQGRIVNGTSRIQPGTVYSGAVSSESKG